MIALALLVFYLATSAATAWVFYRAWGWPGVAAWLLVNMIVGPLLNLLYARFAPPTEEASS